MELTGPYGPYPKYLAEKVYLPRTVGRKVIDQAPPASGFTANTDAVVRPGLIT